MGVLVLLAAAAAATSATPDWSPTITARLDREQAHVGDAVALHVTAIHRQGIRVDLPTRTEMGAFTVLDSKRSSTDLRDGRTRTEFVLRIATYDVGDFEVPAIDVSATGPDGSVRSTSVGPLPLRIVSLLQNVPDAQPRPAAAPVPALRRDWRWVGLTAAALGIGALVALFRWVKRRRAARALQRPAPPPEPAHVVALRRLAELAASDLLARGDVKIYYERLSLALRDYLGARYGLDALDMTTAELRDALAAVGPEAPPAAEVDGLLSGCDLVKFAKHRPDDAVARDALDGAVKIVERTRSMEVVVAS